MSQKGIYHSGKIKVIEHAPVSVLHCPLSDILALASDRLAVPMTFASLKSTLDAEPVASLDPPFLLSADGMWCEETFVFKGIRSRGTANL